MQLWLLRSPVPLALALPLAAKKNIYRTKAIDMVSLNSLTKDTFTLQMQQKNYFSHTSLSRPITESYMTIGYNPLLVYVKSFSVCLHSLYLYCYFRYSLLFTLPTSLSRPMTESYMTMKYQPLVTATAAQKPRLLTQKDRHSYTLFKKDFPDLEEKSRKIQYTLPLLFHYQSYLPLPLHRTNFVFSFQKKTIN